MVRYLISRPVAVLITFTAAVILGVVAYRSIPVSLMPDIPIPEVMVTVNYPNSSARELENSVIRPLRAQIMQAGHLTEMQSITRDGNAVITMRFEYGTNIDFSFVEVNEKIDAVMTMMPRDMQRPGVIKASATDIPVFYLNLALKKKPEATAREEIESFLELSEFAETIIKKRIEQLPEVAMVDISGTVSPLIVIEPDMALMQNYGLTLLEIETALADNNINAGTMTIRDGHYRYNVRISSLLRNNEDIAAIRFNVAGRIITLGDFARVELTAGKRDGMFVSDGQQAVSMAVIKQSDARMADMRHKIDELVTQFENDYPDIFFKASQDQTKLLTYSIVNLKENLLQGMLLVILVVIFFMRDVRLPLLIGFSLMVSVVISLLFFFLVGMSINIISLAGLILAVGNMMDNSIVVTDNITQYRERGEGLADACVYGTNDVILPQLSSMLVNVAVFVPLVFLSGIAGALMVDEALSVLIGLSVSYIVGITFMPVIYKQVYSRISKPDHLFARISEWFRKEVFRKRHHRLTAQRIYESGLELVFKNKTITLILFIMLVPAGLLVLSVIEKERMPQFPEVECVVDIDWNQNINVEENQRRVNDLLQKAGAHVIQYNAYIGRQQFTLNRDRVASPSETMIYLAVNTPDELIATKQMIEESISADYGMATVSFEAPTNIFEKLFGGSQAPLVAGITMSNSAIEPDLEAMLELNEKLNGDPLLKASNSIALQEHLVVEPLMDLLLLYDVDYYNVLRVLRTGLHENQAAVVHSYTSFMPVVLRGSEWSLAEVLERSTVKSRRGEEIPLSALVTVTRSNDLKTIIAGTEGEYLPLVFNPGRKEVESYVTRISEKCKENPQLDVHFSGSAFTTRKLLSEMGLLLMISLILLYFILAAQFESLVLPLIVLVEIPADISAALITLLIAGHTLNLMSAIGLVVMTGILITDSILKLDAFNQLRKEGLTVEEAIREGGHRRFRAIVMTALTSILAVLPLLFSNDMGSELQKPFSYALIGGMTMGTIVSLWIVPLIYWLIYKNIPLTKYI